MEVLRLSPVLLVVILLSCKHELPSATNPIPVDTVATNARSCAVDTVYFRQAILPVLVSNCAVAGCHDAITREEGYVFTDYANVMKVVRAGRPSNSELYEVITETDHGDRMPPPPRAPLSAQQINAIRVWILQGARNNSCEAAVCDTASVTYAATVRPVFENFCTGCHSGASASGGYNFTTFTGVKAAVNNGKLWAAINHLPGATPMPHGGARLSDCNIGKIGIWIRNGSLNN